MPDTGMKSPTSCDSIMDGAWNDVAWTNPGNAVSLNATYASSVGLANGECTHTLRCKGFDFSAIPDGSTINGVTVRIWAMDVSAASCDLMQLLDTGASRVGTNQCAAPVAVNTGAINDITKGGAADLWGNALTRAWVQDADFGVSVGFIADANDTEVYVDHVEMTIYYTEASGRRGAVVSSRNPFACRTVTGG